MIDPARLDPLAARLAAAGGGGAELDRAIHAALRGGGEAVPPYTGSVDASLALVHDLLAGWHWHVGWGASGVLPYAMLSHDHVEMTAEAPTVPLALLKALVQVLRLRC